MVRFFSIISLIGFSICSNAQTVLLEEDFTDGIPEDWTIVDEDGLTPADAVSEFTAAWISFITPSEDTVAASTSFYEPTGQSQDYLITPALTIGNFSRFIWSASSLDASYPDGYYVLISTTDYNIESFTDTLLTIGAESALWNTRSIHLDEEGYANQTVYIAFKNMTNNGYVLLLDNILLLGAEAAGIDSYLAAEPVVTLGPNPATDLLHIRTNEAIINTTIYTLDGRLILNSSEALISIMELEAGTYIAVVETSAGTTPVKFIKK